MAKNVDGKVTLLAGGDVGPVLKPVDQFAELIAPVLQQADIRLAQCERTYSKRGWAPRYISVTSGMNTRLDPEMASVFKAAGINVISLASNHMMEWGPDAVEDTIELFRSWGLQVVGAGKDEKEARRPAVIERNGVKIAILAYCSVLRDGHAAGPDKAGVAPMRSHTYYEAYDYQPGAPPKMITVPFEEDLKALQEDIRRAKAQADVVILSLHWGIRYIPKTISTCQPLVAHAAIDAGADLILGHHPHLLKGVEVYKGKVCFYSIGNFMTTGARGHRVPLEWNLYWFEMEEDSLFRFPVDSKKIMVAKAVMSKRGVERVSFLPTFINKQAQPEALKRGDERFQEILEYAEWVSDPYPHTFKIEGDEIVVVTSA